MRIGIVAFLHESNTFCSQPTNLESFNQNLLLTGESIRTSMQDSHHEVGGFLGGLAECNAVAVPLFAARALPSGTITASAFSEITQRLLESVQEAGDLDGLLVAPHGATVSEEYPDADGHWLQQLRQQVGPQLPIIGTLDPHANLSPMMADSCNALIAYRTNPHLDQRERGIEAASMIVDMVRGSIRPTMATVRPPIAISIDRQCTDEPHLSPLYDFANRQLEDPRVLSNSILLGFPYADVAEMGSALIVVTNDDLSHAQNRANELANELWGMRDGLAGVYISVNAALDDASSCNDRVCLLDMGDNVGGGSSADGTELIAEILRRGIGPAFACLFDPSAVVECERAGVGSKLQIVVGGKSDTIHGDSIDCSVTVVSLHDGRFYESQPRHGGITDFDQGRTAVCRTDSGLTLMLTSRRMVPFSLEQLSSCNVDPTSFRFLVAKGVNAPIAAYRSVCDRFIRVNTVGSTCADMSRLTYQHRRRPLFPLERDAIFSGSEIE